MGFHNSVFINCPFDTSYINDILKPTLFYLINNGMLPRLAIEVSDSGQLRLEKITEILKCCKYGIHDLSLVRSKKVDEFARMNMPFELGIDYGLRKSGIPLFAEKQFLILEAIKYDYQKALSDINGFDIKVHGNDTKNIFECLHSWGGETLKIKKQRPPLKYFYDFMDFNASLFDEKLIHFEMHELAQNYIEKISIPEYMEEIRERI